MQGSFPSTSIITRSAAVGGRPLRPQADALAHVGCLAAMVLVYFSQVLRGAYSVFFSFDFLLCDLCRIITLFNLPSKHPAAGKTPCQPVLLHVFRACAAVLLPAFPERPENPCFPWWNQF